MVARGGACYHATEILAIQVGVLQTGACVLCKGIWEVRGHPVQLLGAVMALVGGATEQLVGKKGGDRG